MRTPRVYLDTSVISHLDQPKKPIEQEYSLRLWDAIIAGEYEVWLSDVVLTEINKCKPDKRERLFDFLSKIKHNNIPLTDELRTFANKILEQKILPSSCEEDSQHIAAAVLTNSEFLLSWNLRHLANFTTNDKVRLLSFAEYNREISIITPSFLLEGD